MKSLAVVAVLLLLSTTIRAQEDVLRPNGRPDGYISSSSSSLPIIFGAELGRNVNFHSQSFSSNPTIENSPEAALSSGSGISPMIGIFADFPITRTVGIQTRLGYDAKSASNTQAGIIDAPLDDVVPGIEGIPSVVPMDVDASYCLSYSTINIAALLRIDLVDNLFVTAGPILQLTVGDVSREDKIAKTNTDDDTFIAVDYEGNPGRFQEISRTTNLAQNLLPSVGNPGSYSASTYNTTRFGLEFGLGYRIDITKSVYLAPNIRYQLMLSQLNGEFTAEDISQPFSQQTAELSYEAGGLNTLAFVLQLGFAL